jgi:hypothetical protein
MGALYDEVQRLDAAIKKSGKDYFVTKGQLSMKAGFMITLVTPSSPDDPAKMAALQKAAREILGA